MCATEQVTGFVVHMRDEHRRLRELLIRIEQNWIVADEGSEPVAPQLSKSLQELRSELVHHFAEEENGGCLEEAACRCPSLSHDVRRVEGEHVTLLNELDAVIKDVPADADSAAFPKQHEAFKRFTAKLRNHETAENQLLETAFGFCDES